MTISGHGLPERRGSRLGVGVTMRELGGDSKAEAGVRPELVVLAAPSLDEDARLGAAAKPPDAQAFVAQLALTLSSVPF